MRLEVFLLADPSILVLDEHPPEAFEHFAHTCILLDRCSHHQRLLRLVTSSGLHPIGRIAVERGPLESETHSVAFLHDLYSEMRTISRKGDE